MVKVKVEVEVSASAEISLKLVCENKNASKSPVKEVVEVTKSIVKVLLESIVLVKEVTIGVEEF